MPDNKGMRNLCFIFLFTLVFAACKKQTTVTQSALGTATSACLIGKWNQSALPLAVKMSPEFSGDITGSMLVSGLNPLENMAKQWNDPVAATKTLITVPFPVSSLSGYSSTSSFRDSEIGIYKSYNWFSNVSSSALAITQFYGVVTSSAGLGQYIELTHADIIVNYRDYGSRFTMGSNPTIEFDLPTVILHEMGHLLGLCHESTKSSIMAPYYLTAQRSLQNFDKELIQDIYVDGAITGLTVKNKNTNALESPVGTEVKGIIELNADGKCKHFLNGKKIYEHIVK